MAAADIDAYLETLDATKRATLEQLRRTILSIVPEAEQTIAYNMPAFKLDGEVVAGFAAFKNHLSYLPHSGSVLSVLADDLKGYTMTPGSLHFAVDRSLPKTMVKKLIAVRMREIEERQSITKTRTPHR
jgi:uncharacterized protein YdhG (YjbR/CyaY superfamily)